MMSFNGFVASPLLFALFLLFGCHLAVMADWIDPDTPWEARTTKSYPPKIRPVARSDNTNTDQGTSRTSRHKKHENRTTAVPTSAPSFSTSAPTPAPSSSPSESPTRFPRDFELVFSDEFNTPFRSFHDGTDPRWTALEKNDYTNDALHYYSADNAQTNEHGELVITSAVRDTDIVGFDDVKLKRTRVTKHFLSAMLQSWNKFCFTGGIIEAEVTMPGRHNVGGLWPAFWLLGNLARHTYVGTSEHIWPWSSTTCTSKSRDAQKISGCNRITHYGLEHRFGRGAPEMDIFEVQPGPVKRNQGPFLKTTVGQPFMSASFQVAPGRSENRPGPSEWPGPKQWYKHLKVGENSSLNILFYGNYNHFRGDLHPERQDYWSDAISVNRQLRETHFNKPHVYRMEWDVPSEGNDGYLNWFVDGDLVSSLDGRGLREAGYGAEISSEPSYVLLNTAISKQWGFPSQCPANCPCKEYDCSSTHWERRCGFSEGFCDMMKGESSPKYKINWVRVYQDPNNPTQKVGCSTPERPTRRYIEAHESLYREESDERPLKGIQRGNGPCNPIAVGVAPEACGGSERGRCTPGKVCECLSGWTGPHCLAHQGRDPILYDQPDSIVDVGFIPPKILPTFLMVGFGCLVLLLLVALQYRNQMEGWTPIPDADVVHRQYR